MPAFLNRLRYLMRRTQSERELEAELQDHLERETQANIQSGMNPEEARFAARRLLGPVEVFKEESREATGIRFLETSRRDLRYALRMLRRTPLFTAVALLTLGIGIGANTAVFTFIEHVLLRSLPVDNPDRVFAVNFGGVPNLSYPNYVDFRDRNHSFSSLAACAYNPANMSAPHRGNFRMWGYEATGNYFQMLGVEPLLGRFFGPQDDTGMDAHPVMVISFKAWQSRFGADPNIIGQTLKLNGFPFTIIGVSNASFSGTELVLGSDYWVPMSMAREVESGAAWMQYRTAQDIWVVGRLHAGVSPAQAEANLNSIASQLARQFPDAVSSKDRVHLGRPGLLGDGLRGPISGFGAVLMGVTSLGLLLACVNLAGMLLARASERRREIAIRLAIGAGRSQLLRQLLTESLLLALGGGLIGFSIAYLACGSLRSWQPAFDLPVRFDLEPNAAVLAFTVALACITTVLFGLAPALQTVRVDLVPSLKNEPATLRFGRFSMRDLLVTAQVALSVVLVVCSVLVVHSLQNALTLKMGFNPNGAVSLSFDLKIKGYDPESIHRFQAELLHRVNDIPGVQSAGLVNTLPLAMQGDDSEFLWADGQPVPTPSNRHLAMTYKSSPGYLRASGTTLLAGRDFDDHDRATSPATAIINQSFGRLLFGDGNPIGRHVRLSSVDSALVVVGLIEDGKYRSLSDTGMPAIYLPIAQQVSTWNTLVARTPLAPQAIIPQLHKAIQDLDPDVTIFGAGSLTEHLALPLFAARLAALVLGAFGLFAMALAAIGLFALVSYTVARRTREIGIRMALGATRPQILRSLLMRTLLLCAAGISLGVVVTFAAGGLLSAVLYGVSPRDPVSYALVLVMMALVSLSACWAPATRAIRINPLRALRED